MAQKKQQKQANEPDEDARLELDRTPIVLVTDSFDDNFAPLCFEGPKCLVLRLHGHTLLDCFFDWADANDCTEIFVLAKDFADLIFERVNEKKSLFKRMRIVCFRVSPSCGSLGDCLRDFEGRKECLLPEQDFVLIGADSFCTFELAPALAFHKRARAASPPSIVTKIFTDFAGNSSELRQSDADNAVVYNSSNGRLLAVESLRHKKHVSLPLGDLTELMESDGGEGAAVAVRTDLLDPHIFICSGQILSKFCDSFDYGSVDTDIIGELLEGELSSDIATVFISNGTAVHLSTPRVFAATAIDAILFRQGRPLAGDGRRFAVHGKSDFVFLTRNVKLKESSILGPSVIIQDGSALGENVELKRTIVGRNCDIGKDSLILGCILFDNVSIGTACRVSHSLLSDGVQIGDGSSVGAGCILGAGVRIAAGMTIPPGTRLMCCMRTDTYGNNDGFDDEDTGDMANRYELVNTLPEGTNEVGLVGSDGAALLYTPRLPPEELQWQLMGASILPSIELATPDPFPEEEEDGSSRKGSADVHPDDAFRAEIQSIIFAAVSDPSEVQNRIKEARIRRVTCNQTCEDALREIVPVVIAALTAKITGADEGDAKKVLEEKFESLRLASIFRSFVSRDAKSQAACCDAVLEFCSRPTVNFEMPSLPEAAKSSLNWRPESENVMRHKERCSMLFEILSDLEILDDEFFVTWWEERKADQDSSMSEAATVNGTRFTKFVEHLRDDDDDEEG